MQEKSAPRPIAVLRAFRSTCALVLLPEELWVIADQQVERRISIARIWSLHVDLGPTLYLLLGESDEAEMEIVALPLPGLRGSQYHFLRSLLQLGQRHPGFLQDGGYLIEQLQNMQDEQGEPLVQREPLEPAIDERSIRSLFWGVASLLPIPGPLAAPIALERGIAALRSTDPDAARLAAWLGVLCAATSILGWGALLAATLFGSAIDVAQAPWGLVDISSWQIGVIVAVVVVAFILHEYAHALVAYWRGDRTAKRLGRLTILPWRHISLLGTVAVPAMLSLLKAPFVFGWAKPVPIIPPLMRDPRSSIAEVGFAGPAINYTLALMAGWWLVVVGSCLQLWGGVTVTGLFGATWVQVAGAGMLDGPLSLAAGTLKYGLLVNMVFASFNMLPIPPLDGSKIASPLLSDSLADKVNGRPGVFFGLATLVVLVVSGLVFVVLGLVALPAVLLLVLFGWTSGLAL